jgi:hypothetical protein
MHTTHITYAILCFFFPSFHLGLKTIIMEMELVQQRKKEKKNER